MSFSASSSFQRGDLASLVERIRGGATVAVEATTNQVFQQSQVLVPILTGDLHNSGNSRVEQMPDGPCGYVDYDESYSWYVEFGTSRQRAQPYLRPPLDAAHSLFMDTVKTEVGNVV